MSLEFDNKKTKKTIMHECLLSDLKLVKRRKLTKALRTWR